MTSFPDEIVLHVCATCRPDGGPDATEDRPGSILLRALSDALAARAAAGAPLPVRVEAVKCLSVCKRPCTVAATAPGRWTYVWGDLDPAAHVDDILEGIARYAATSDGVVPWRERPQIFKSGVVARVPPYAPPSPRLDAAE